MGIGRKLLHMTADTFFGKSHTTQFMAVEGIPRTFFIVPTWFFFHSLGMQVM